MRSAAAAEEEQERDAEEVVANASGMDSGNMASMSSSSGGDGNADVMPDGATEPARQGGQSIGRRRRKVERLERKRKKNEALCISVEKRAEGEGKAARTGFQLVSVAPDGRTSLVRCW